MTRHSRKRVALSLLIGLCAVAPATVAVAAPTPGAVHPLVIESVVVAGAYGVPADAAMVAVNVTVVNPAQPGYVTVDACDTIRRDTSNVNYLTDQVVPNLVLSRISPDGTICVATLALTDVIVDVVGYVPSGSAITALPTPVRALDTRAPGGPTSPVAGGQRHGDPDRRLRSGSLPARPPCSSTPPRSPAARRATSPCSRAAPCPTPARSTSCRATSWPTSPCPASPAPPCACTPAPRPTS